MKVIAMGFKTRTQMKVLLLSILFFTIIGITNTTAQTTVNLPAACDNCADPDTDGDGIPNSTDTDDDNDGVDDSSDSCSLTFGSANYNGCPPYGALESLIPNLPPTSTGVPSPWKPTASDWSGSAGTLVLDISSLQLGQCIDNWPTGYYAVKYQNTTGNDVLFHVLLKGSPTGGGGAASEITQQDNVFNGSTEYLKQHYDVSSVNYSIFHWVTQYSVAGNGQYGSVICLCRTQ